MADDRNKISKYRRPVNLNIGMMIFMVIFIYVVICVVMYFKTDHIVGYSVMEGSLTSNKIYTGIALRDEEIVVSQDAGYINYFAREGERAAVGNLIYTVDETGRLSEYIKAGESGENTLSESDLSELRTEIISFTNRFDCRQFGDVYNFKHNVEGTVLKLANYNILENADALNDASGTSLINYRSAADSGIVVLSTDGYEKLTLEDMKAEYFEKENYEKKYFVNNDLVAAGDPVYKLSTSEDWSIVIMAEQDLVDMLKKEQEKANNNELYVEVRFLKNQYTAWGKVDIYTNEEGDNFVSLTFTNSMVTFCTDRFIDIELLLKEEKGLKIPNTAIVQKEFFIVPKEYVTKGGKRGENGVLLETYDDEGNVSIQFVETPIYHETETEYADFKEISILYDNEEYSVVKSNTMYGLNVYDYIVLDASMVDDNEFIYE